MKSYLLILILLSPLAAAQSLPVITHETQWYFQGQPCGTKEQCKELAITAAEANPGQIEQVFPAPYDVTVQVEEGTPCPNIGAMQPGDSYSNGLPVFNDPCHKGQ